MRESLSRKRWNVKGVEGEMVRKDVIGRYLVGVVIWFWDYVGIEEWRSYY